ncbi:MAG: single-stranded-DNA-specific exonuclease RecJ [Candidatus Omnitrophica bacterium]|nr:single-stranded-DNA-specific exonuclease RecJ [Candidatus Omnitrophota bacterium]
MPRKKWKLKTPRPDLQTELRSSAGISPVLAQLLVNRGIQDPAGVDRFLNPKLEHLHDPFLLKGMDRAVARLRRARERGETVMVYGDYDVDGVTGTAVLSRLMQSFGVRALTYIPHRMEEGYGLNYDIVPEAKAAGVSLLVTVDCGITSAGEVEELSRQGIETIVIDHHEPDPGRIPDAVAVIDPRQPGDTYSFRDLAGVGLAAKFAQAVLGRFPEEDLDLVALGTIADVVPLLGENRILAKHGLPRITKSAKEGLRALIELSRIAGKEITTHSVGFVLGPRLNAAGRMGTANTSLDLLLSDDAAGAAVLARALEAHNRERQRLQSALVDEALEMLAADPRLAEEPVIVVHKEGWHKGVLGIAAARLADRFGRPAIIIAMEDGVGVGSARSVEGFHLNEALAHCAGVLEGFGGHRRAAGLRVKDEHMPEFRSRINSFAREILAARDLTPSLDVDAELSLAAVSTDLVETVGRLEPHGEGNPSPLFATRRLLVKSRPQTMGKDTLKFWVTDGRMSVSAVGFGMAAENAGLQMGQAVDLVYTLGIDDWNKPAQVQLTIKDLRYPSK